MDPSQDFRTHTNELWMVGKIFIANSQLLQLSKNDRSTVNFNGDIKIRK